MLLSPLGTTNGDSPDPIPLPPMAFTNTLWLGGFAHTLWLRRRRCVATWLAVDFHMHRWLPPIIPHQRCGRDGAAWRLDPLDFADLPPFCMPAGSFQTGPVRGPEEALSYVPPLDRLHLVQGVGAELTMLFCFVCAEGAIQCVDPEGVIVDDWQAVIDSNSDRLQML